MTITALLLAALIAGAEGQPADPPGDLADPVLAEMAPAPGRWEIEDAPAYFSNRQAISDARAAGEPAAHGDPVFDPVLAAELREGVSLVARHP